MLRKGPSGSPCGDKEWEGPSQSSNPRGVSWGPEETMHSRDAAEVGMAQALESFAVCSVGAD